MTNHFQKKVRTWGWKLLNLNILFNCLHASKCSTLAAKSGTHHANLWPSGSLMRSSTILPFASGISVNTRVTRVVQLLTNVCNTRFKTCRCQCCGLCPKQTSLTLLNFLYHNVCQPQHTQHTNQAGWHVINWTGSEVPQLPQRFARRR